MANTPSIDQLKRAVEIAGQIEKLEKELAGILGILGSSGGGGGARRGRPPVAAASADPGDGAAKKSRKRRTMSPEARERIAAAQRARWAKQKKGSGS